MTETKKSLDKAEVKTAKKSVITLFNLDKDGLPRGNYRSRVWLRHELQFFVFDLCLSLNYTIKKRRNRAFNLNN